MCDFCLDDIENNEMSPDRKRKNANNTNNAQFKQSTLSPNVNGKLAWTQQQVHTNKSGASGKKNSNEQLHEMLTSISGKIDSHSNVLNEIGHKVCAVGNEVITTKKKIRRCVQYRPFPYDAS